MEGKDKIAELDERLARMERLAYDDGVPRRRFASLHRMDERYREDPGFKMLVDFMMKSAYDLEFSPGEMREAAVFAEITFQRLNPNPRQF